MLQLVPSGGAAGWYRAWFQGSDEPPMIETGWLALGIPEMGCMR